MHSIKCEKVEICPACGSADATFWCRAHDRLHHTTDQTFEYRSCNACRTLFQSVRPLESEVWKCYSNAYGPHSGKSRLKALFNLPVWLNRGCQKAADLVLGQARFQGWIRQVEKKLVKAGDILDFGCGSGKYLDRARKLGCTTLGIDFSPKALEEVKRRGHDTMPVSADTWNAIATRKLRFVRMNHVVEHLYGPLRVFRKIHDAMDEGGCLHLSTPNPVGPSATRYRDAWWGLECPRHIALIPPGQLEKMLRKVGFKTVTIMHEPIAKDFLRSWAYRRHDAGKLKNVDIEGLAGDGLLNLLSALPMRKALQITGQGDRYHVLAVK
jgi:2-polyprenyl-3-methyl-5-hydroxy-6-metoxy-1,4-benzoquinol methylase